MTQKLATTLQGSSKCKAVSGLRGSSSAWLAALAAKEGNCCCIVPDEHLVSIFKQDLGLFTDKHILSYPGHEIPPYTLLSPDQHITAARLSTLYQLKERDTGYIMVTSIEALLRRVMPGRVLTGVAEYLMAGEECDQDSLLNALISGSFLGGAHSALSRETVAPPPQPMIKSRNNHTIVIGMFNHRGVSLSCLLWVTIFHLK